MQNLEELLKFTPSSLQHSVDRLMTQQTVIECHQIYKLLQEELRTNSGQLKTAFKSNYDSLVKCEPAITNLLAFNTKLESLQNNLNTILTQNIQERYHQQQQSSVIERAERQMRKGHFTEALRLCVPESDSPELISHYLGYMKLQILEALERQLRGQVRPCPPFSELIQNAVSAIQCYIEITPIQQLRSIREPIPSIAFFIAQAIENQRQLNEHQIIEVLFRYKMVAFAGNIFGQEEKLIRIKQLVFGLQQLLNYEVDNVDQNRLMGIFIGNYEHICKHLAQIFIRQANPLDTQVKHSHKEPVVNFQSSLYHQLMLDPEFLKALDYISNVTSSSLSKLSNPQPSISSFFNQLWQNYSKMMVNTLTEQLYKRSLPHKQFQPNTSPIPQLNKYSTCSPFSTELSQLQSYEEQLEQYKQEMANLSQTQKVLGGKCETIGKLSKIIMNLQSQLTIIEADSPQDIMHEVILRSSIVSFIKLSSLSLMQEDDYDHMLSTLSVVIQGLARKVVNYIHSQDLDQELVRLDYFFSHYNQCSKLKKHQKIALKELVKESIKILKIDWQ